MRVGILGSSPLALLDAIDAAASGHDVVVFEGTAGLGGAWGVTSFAGFVDVEIGCHLLERESAGYDRLRAAGVDLAPLDPQPMTALRPGLRQAYVSPIAAAARLAYQPVARVLRRSSATTVEWKRRVALAAKELRDAITDRSPVLGPVGGAGRMVATLATAARHAGAEIRTDTTVTQIDLSDAAPVVHTDQGAETFDLMIVTAACRPATVFVDGTPLDGPVRRRRFEHRLLALPTGSVRPHSYWRFPRDPLLQRSASITVNASRRSGDDHELVLVSVSPDAAASVEALVARLARHGLVEPGTTPIDHRVVDYTGVDAADTLVTALGHRRDVLVRRSYGDLTRSIVDSPRLDAGELGSPRPSLRTESAS
ncbi:MAG: FAD-dependent oxidoreductase [Actinomycetota bacterium]